MALPFPHPRGCDLPQRKQQELGQRGPLAAPAVWLQGCIGLPRSSTHALQWAYLALALPPNRMDGWRQCGAGNGCCTKARREASPRAARNTPPRSPQKERYAASITILRH